MYLERVKGIQARFHAYQEKTKRLELQWRLPVPVPTNVRSQLYDYYYTWSRFELDDGSLSDTSLAVFVRNPNHKLNLNDPKAFMTVKAPFGQIEDLLAIFNTHVDDHDMGTVINEILLFKGVIPESPQLREEAERFTFLVNREIAMLFTLAVENAQARALINTRLELDMLEQATFRSLK